MILDLRLLPDHERLSADICIIGAGAAGIAMACELRTTGLSVLVLESGGFKKDRAVQALYEGEVADPDCHPPIHLFRRRGFGGTTTIWGGRCMPLDDFDFEPRDHVPHSGWPIRYRDFEPFYHRALQYCEAGRYSFTVADSLPGAPTDMIEGFRSDIVLTDRIERYSCPTDFGRRYRADLRMADNVKLFLHANCLRLCIDRANRRVESAEVATLGGKSFSVRARHFVLAAGGLESTRLLLVSNDGPAGGRGDGPGCLGRFYMCHIDGTLGALRPQPPSRAVVNGFERCADGIYCRRTIRTSGQAQRTSKTLNFVMRLHHPIIVDPRHQSGILSAIYLAKELIPAEYKQLLTMQEIVTKSRMGRASVFWAKHARNLVADFPELAIFSAKWLRYRILSSRKLPYVMLPGRKSQYTVEFCAEQSPNPDSRVRLGDKTDRFGVPRLVVDWRMSDLDIQSVVGTYRLIRDEFARSGFASLLFDDETIETEARGAHPVGGHHIGTTRMAAEPSGGVVDRNCRVFGCHNLFVCSSSVFVTSGHANPTLTIVATAVRLADHLKCLHAGRANE